ncbi:MAG: carboxymuconolactone decarboxylase family protein [Chitinophagales bacterium]|nr:carboxymuconolactone decarboxylase family protein [Chitinophagales bacterium]
MAYIELDNPYQGIRGLLVYSPDTALPLLQLANSLLQTDSELTKGERELIATYVSYKNDCRFCQLSHGGAAAHHVQCSLDDIEAFKKDMQHSQLISDKMKALLYIAEKVQQGGKNVSQEDINAAKDLGATDKQLHDTVLIAAAFCMFNRYVDGMNTWSEEDPATYMDASSRMAEQGYLRKETLDMIAKRKAALT